MAGCEVNTGAGLCCCIAFCMCCTRCLTLSVISCVLQLRCRQLQPHLSCPLRVDNITLHCKDSQRNLMLATSAVACLAYARTAKCQLHSAGRGSSCMAQCPRWHLKSSQAMRASQARCFLCEQVQVGAAHRASHKASKWPQTNHHNTRHAAAAHSGQPSCHLR